MRFAPLQALLALALLPRVPSAQQPRTYSITTVDSAQLHAVPASSPIDALRGKVPGARVTALSNEPGVAPLLQLRGSYAVPLGDPVVVLDGAISPLGLADINVDDVERIEVIPGAAGAAAYGAGGSNGVVVITTRRGGDTSYVTARADLGISTLPRRLPVSLHHLYQLDGSGQFVRTVTGTRVPEADQIEDNAYPVLYDKRGEIIGPRFTRAEYVAGARTYRGARIFGSLGDEQEPGVLTPLRGYSRSTLRLNLDRAFGPKVDVAANIFGGSASLGSAETNPFFLLSFVEPSVPRDSALANNPYYVVQHTRSSLDRDRIGWRLSGEVRPMSFLKVRGTLARDRAREDSRADFTSANQLSSTRFNNFTDRSRFTQLVVSAGRAVGRDVDLSAHMALAAEKQRISGAQTFVAAPLPPFPPGPGSTSSFASSWSQRSTTVGAQTRWRDRLTLEGLVRRDHESTLGATGEQLWHHRVSAAWSQGSTIVHLADGTASTRLGPDFLLNAPVVLCPIGATCGPFLRHPFAREVEGGVAQRFLGRFDARYTLSRQRTIDQLYLVPVPQPATVNFAWRNLGTTVGTTHEASLGARVMASRGVDWGMRVNAHRVRVKLTHMTSPPFFTGPFASNFLFRVDTGQSLGTMYGYQPIRTDAQLQETLRAGALAGTAADYVRNEEGYFVRAVDLHTLNERPLTAFQCSTPAPTPCTSSTQFLRIGNADPDLDLGVVNTITWKTFSLNATVTAVRGGNIYNYARWVAFNGQRDVVYDQTGKPAAERKPASYYTWFYSSPNELFVENGSYLKLSELAVGWRIPGKRAARAVITGRNLLTSSRYGGYDPDVAAGEAMPYAFRIDGLSYPAYRTLGVRLELVN